MTQRDPMILRALARCTVNDDEAFQKKFDRIVHQAIRRIPREIRRHMQNILISVQKRPSR